MKKFNVLLLTLALVFVKVSAVEADTLTFEISGNGSESVNQVVSDVSTETNVSQSNDSQVNNQVNIEADTGNNQANQNTGGETEISTGDVQTEIKIENQLNTSLVQTGCCEESQAEVLINNNGEQSNNTVELNLSSKTDISINQEAEVTNKVNLNLNTGKNSANQNNGDVSISTGDIKGSVNIQNSANQSWVEALELEGYQIEAKIKANGSNSINQISINSSNSKNIDIHQYADIDNILNIILNTGENDASENLGSVTIDTGNIDFEVGIKNGLINFSAVNIGGCDPDDQPEPDEPNDPAPPPPSPGTGGSDTSGNNNGTSSSDSDSKGTVLGVGGGGILPATGANWLLLALLANIAMFLMGLYLRLRSGRSPGTKTAKVYA